MKVGLHARNDQKFTAVDWAILEQARIEAIKTLSLTVDSEYAEIRLRWPDMLIIERLYADMRGGPPSPSQFVADHAARMIDRRDQFGVVDFEIHNEPNHLERIEGWGQTRGDAVAFSAWFIQVVDRLRQEVPGVRLGFPGLAVPHQDLEWLEWARPAIETADWLGCHVYWQSPNGQTTWRQKFWGKRYEYYHEAFPDKPIHITEYGNSNGQSGLALSREDQATQYAEWLTEAQQNPYLHSSCAFISTSPDPRWHNDGFTWASQSGAIYPVVAAVAAVPRSSGNGGNNVPDHDKTTLFGDQIAEMLADRLGDKFVDDRLRVRVHPEWGTRRYFANVDSRGMDWLVLHHTASPRSTTVDQIANYHIDSRDMAGFGYHFLIRLGKLYYVGDLNTMRAHIRDQNHRGIGISITGTYIDSLPASEDVALLKVLIDELDALYGAEKTLIGHRFVPSNGHTSCPGRIVELIPTLRDDEVDPFAGWSIGPGVVAEMRRRGDVPLSDEVYMGQWLSMTMGAKALYLWSKKAQKLKMALFE